VSPDTCELLLVPGKSDPNAKLAILGCGFPVVTSSSCRTEGSRARKAASVGRSRGCGQTQLAPLRGV